MQATNQYGRKYFFTKVFSTSIFVFYFGTGIYAQGPGGVTTGLTSWFKADGLVTGVIGTWNSSVGATSVTSTGFNRPLCFSYATDATKSLNLNYNQGLYFDGSNDVLKNTTVTGLLGDNGTVYMAHRVDVTEWNTAFSSHEGTNNREYQIKPARVGFTQNLGNMWQINQSYYVPSSTFTKMRITGFKGTTSASASTDYNGNVGSSVLSTSSGALVNANLCFGSDGIGQYSNSTIPEVITYNRNLTTAEMNRVDSYLAIKYGITLGVNGTSKNYLNSSAATVWSAAANAGYANDVAGIGRDDNSTLSQLRSHSVNGSTTTTYSDIVNIANGTSVTSPSSFTADQSFFIWGHNGGVLNNTGALVNFTTENAVFIETIFSRVWKAQESGTVGTVTLQFDLTGVMGAFNITNNNDLANLRLLVDEDGVFNNTSYALSPSSFNNVTQIAEFQYDFVTGAGMGKGFYFTLASIDANNTPLPIELVSFNANKNGNQVDLHWKTASEHNSDYFEVEKSLDAKKWEHVCSQKGAGNSSAEINYYDVDRTPYSGLSYYRLTEYDKDGVAHPYNIVSMQYDVDGVKIYPNPSSSSSVIQFSSETDNNEVQLSLYDNTSRLVSNQTYLAEAGSNNVMLDLTQLSNGIYFMKIIIGGKEPETVKLEVRK